MVESFPMVPASAKVLWLIVPVSVLLTAVLLALVYSAYSSRAVHFDVSPTGLHVVGDFYGRAIPASALDLHAARTVDLDVDHELRPRWRTLGTGLPGYSSGWFRLRDGQKALVYVTDRRRVAYIPTREGYSLLLSAADPDRLIASLRATATAAH